MYAIDSGLIWLFVFTFVFGVFTGAVALFWIIFILVKENGSKIIIENVDYESNP